MRVSMFLLPVLVILGALGLASVYVVDERENVLVLQFGQLKQTRDEPGLHFKLPIVQEVVRYDSRILGLQSEPLEVTPLDDRRLIVDAFARWRIVDTVRFRESVGVEGVSAAQGRMERIMNAAIREVLGSVPSGAVLSEDRTALMNRIRDLARREAATLGVEVVDVRLTRTDLPEQNLEATYARMRAEREREAADERARGEEAAQRVRALADRTVVEIVSTAEREAEVVRGEADAERNAVYAEAFGRDEEFFAFTRSLTSYERALRGENSTMVMRPDSQFFQYLRGDGTQALEAVMPEADADEEDTTDPEGEARLGDDLRLGAGRLEPAAQ